MNQQKNDLLISIAHIEKKINLAKKEEEMHKRYFSQLASKRQYLFIALLIPAFLSGWRSGRGARAGKFLQRFGKFSFLTAVNLARNYSKLIPWK